mgnify:CR=1
MSNRLLDVAFAATCLTVASCAPADKIPRKEVFFEDPCGPVFDLRRTDIVRESSTGAPEGMVEVYVGGPARLPDGCT